MNKEKIPSFEGIVNSGRRFGLLQVYRYWTPGLLSIGLDRASIGYTDYERFFIGYINCWFFKRIKKRS
jgi:hypothetical protein